jgi:hypothetical protein
MHSLEHFRLAQSESALRSIGDPISKRLLIGLALCLQLAHRVGGNRIVRVIHLSECIGDAGGFTWTDYLAAFVDPDGSRHVDHVVKFGDQMLPIDQAWVCELGRLDPRLGGSIAAAVEGDRDWHESFWTEFLVEGLPDWQVKAASSPRGP